MIPYDHDFVAEQNLLLNSILESKNGIDRFSAIVIRLDALEDRYLPELFGFLSYLRDPRSLKWIEDNVGRCVNIAGTWGHLAACSHITWERSESWLSRGRPLSLVALDVIWLHTTTGPRLNQSPLMREINPRYPSSVSSAKIAHAVSRYADQDDVARVRFASDAILSNLFGAC